MCGRLQEKENANEFLPNSLSLPPFTTYLGMDYKAFSYIKGMAGVLARSDGRREQII
jgi:hypothetical protein